MAKFIGHPAFRVHTQSGSLKRAIKGKMASLSPPRYRIDTDIGIAPHLPYVIKGTRVMLGRDVLWDTAIAEGTRKLVAKRGADHMRKTLKAQSFRSGSVVANMRATKVNMHLGAVLAVNIMGGTLLEKIKLNTALRDHTLADLADLDHPYARRHGNIRIHG